MTAEISTAFVDLWIGWLWDALWQTCVIGTIALLIAAAVGRRRPALAYGIITLALLKFLIPPLLPAPASLRPALSFVSPAAAEEPRENRESGLLAAAGRTPISSAWPIADPQDSRLQDETLAYRHLGGGAVTTSSAAQDARSPIASAEAAVTAPRWVSAVAAMYLTGLCAMSGWIGVGCVRVRRLVAAASLPDARLTELWQQTHRQVVPRRAVRLLVSDQRIAPLAFSLLGPVVVFPRELLETLDTSQQRMVLTHELLHHRRRDPWCIALELCVLVLWWFHPIAWLLVRSSRSLRERCCDEATVRVLDEPAVQYASVLERVAHWLAGQRVSFPLMSATMHPIGIRIHHLLSSLGESRPMKLRMALSLLAIWGLFCLPTLRTGDSRSATTGTAIASDDPKTPAAQPQRAGDAASSVTETRRETDADSLGAVATDRYGDPLPEGALARLGTGRLRHTSNLSSVAFSPDGRILASAGPDMIRFWDPATGESLRDLTVHSMRGLAFSPDGTKLASTSERGIVSLWETATGEEIWKQQKHEKRATGVAFFPGGATFATAGGDCTVRIWDVATGEELRILHIPQAVRDWHSSNWHALSISPDGSLLACGTKENIFVYNLETDGEPTVIENAHGRDIVSITFTPDGEEIISSGRSKLEMRTDEHGRRMGFSFSQILSWNIEHATLREFIAEEGDSHSSTVTLSSDGRRLVSLHSDKIRIWDRSSGELLRTISENKNEFNAVTDGLAISPDQTLLAAVGRHHNVQLWNLETGERHLHFAESHLAAVTNVACSPDSRVIASGDNAGDIRLWNAKSRRMTQVVPLSREHESSFIRSLTFSPDGSVVAAVGDEHTPTGFGGTATLSRLDGTEVWSKSVTGRGTALAFSEDSQIVAIAEGMGTPILDEENWEPRVCIYSVRSGAIQQQIQGLKGQVLAMKLSKDGSSLRIADRHASSTWDTRTGEKQSEFSPSPDYKMGIGGAAFTTAGDILATSIRWEDLIILWDVDTGEELRRFQIENTKGNTLAFSADGALLATASTKFAITHPDNDVNIHLWDVRTGRHLAQFAPGIDPPTALAFMPDGKQIMTGMADGTILLWNLPKMNH